MIKRFANITLKTTFLASVLVVFSFMGLAEAKTASGSNLTATQNQHLTNIKSKGDAEINRRLVSLNQLSELVNTATKLTPVDKSILNNQVTSEISNLTALKTKLDGETTLDAAIADAKSIFTDYRVYALVVPKVWLVKTADNQQALENQLNTLATKLQARIVTLENSGKDVSGLQNDLDNMNTQIKNSENISVSVEQKLVNLQPSDYNSDHAILTGYSGQLKTAHGYNQAAYNYAKAIVNSLK